MAAFSDLRHNNLTTQEHDPSRPGCTGCVDQFFDRLTDYTGSPDRCITGMSDLYYVPRHLVELFSSSMEVFLRHSVFLEIAVPTTLVGIADPEEVVTLHGTNLWGDNRTHPWRFFSPEEDFYIHPIKLSVRSNVLKMFELFGI